MNTLLLRESDLEINAYLNSLSLHQSFEEEDTEDEEFYTVNPSGSVLQPASNPYNKQKKIAEANEILFAEEVAEKSPQRVKFNKVEKRICYDYFGSSFESDSIKSYEDDESEKEVSLKQNIKVQEEASEVKCNYLQPQNPANKVVVTVVPKQSDCTELSDSESEDVCVGKVEQCEGSAIEVNKGVIIKEITEEVTNENVEEREPSHETLLKNKINMDMKSNECLIRENTELNQNYNLEDNESKNAQVNGSIVPALIDLDMQNNQKYSNSSNDFDLFPCLVNHSGITIRITGADSIESVESESSDNELQLLENYNNFTNIVDFGQDLSFPISKLKNINIKARENILNAQKQTFILKGTKTKPSVRTPKRTMKYDISPPQQRLQTKNREHEKTKLTENKNIDKKEQNEKSKSKMRECSRIVGSEDKVNKQSEGCTACSRKARPTSSVEKESRKVRVNPRPVTAPAKRTCCQYGHPHLPEYNGLRSEYGLSAEQLLERKRLRLEAQRMQKQRREQKFKEEQEKRKENEATFIAWLESKRKQSQMQFLRNQKIQAESGIKIYPAPTAHLKKTGAVRSRKRFKPQRKCVSLEEILNNASSHEKKTYKIYLGLSFD